MSSLHRRWSNRVQVPQGKGWTPSGSVAECLSWHTNRVPDEQYGSQVTFTPNLEITETTRINGTLEARTVTPLHRVLTPKPPSRNAWSSYKVDGDQYKLDTFASGTYTPQPPDVFRDTVIESQRPGSKLSRYETSKTFDVCQDASDAFAKGTGRTYDPEREELIRDFLTRKEIESYEREIENERQKLYEDTQRAYEDHIRTMTNSRNSRLNSKAASEAVKAHISKTVPPCTPLDTYNGRLSTKPPVPKAPTYGQYPKTPHPRKYSAHGQRTLRPTSTAYGLNDSSKLDNTLITKRVAFQSPRPDSAGLSRGEKSFLSKKSDHFFQWRDAVSPAVKASLNRDDQLWKMSRFTKSAQPRINTKWDSDSRVGSAYQREAEKGKVNVNVACPEGETMDVELSISHSPTKVI